MPLEGAVHDCACGRRYIRGVIDIEASEHARSYCPCRALLGEWRGAQRLIFDPEDPLQPPTPD